MTDAIDQILAFQRDTEALAQIAGRLGWDQETVMPRGAADQRGEEIAALESVLHARRTDPRLGDWLAAAKPRNESEARALALIARSRTRTARVPARLATELARLTSLAQGIWAGARAAEDVAAFLPTLAEVVARVREKGEALAEGGDPYDALLEDYEPGATGASLAAMFATLRPRLVALREAVLAAAHQPRTLAGAFPAAGQLALARELATAFGYDWAHGRMDTAVHPFCSGSGDDVRLTTRTVEGEPFNCLYSAIHETGHAGYEQSVDKAYRLTPLGTGASMGVHESQSRIYENQLGRSAAFTGWLFERMRATFGDIGVATPEEFYATANRVGPGYIRTEADEVQYNLHVLLRFDLERALISGDLAVADLEAAWNDRFARDFGFAVDKPSHGLLQDVHWSCGLIGYFPTYTLGNVYAGCLHEAMRAALPDLDGSLSHGDATPATRWLGERLQRHGALREPEATITEATGQPPSAEPLLTYLEGKFRALYRL